VVLLILIDAIVVAVVMALAVAVYRQYDTLDSNALRRLTW
jgi:NADH:ubiquinone oxidoreductase subunit K